MVNEIVLGRKKPGVQLTVIKCDEVDVPEVLLFDSEFSLLGDGTAFVYVDTKHLSREASGKQVAAELAFELAQVESFVDGVMIVRAVISRAHLFDSKDAVKEAAEVVNGVSVLEFPPARDDLVGKIVKLRVGVSR